MGEFLFGCLFCAVIMFAVVGFTGLMKPEIINPEEILQANVICDHNNGVKWIELDYQYHDVYCADGALFRNAINSEAE